MTSKEFIYWLKGFIDYQQLQEQKNPAFTRIKDELVKVSDFNTNGATALLTTCEDGGNSTVTYKTDSPITYTTKQKSTVTSYI